MITHIQFSPSPGPDQPSVSFLSLQREGHGDTVGECPLRALRTKGRHGDPADHKCEDPLHTRWAAGKPSAYGKQPEPSRVAPGSQDPVRRPFLRTGSRRGRMV